MYTHIYMHVFMYVCMYMREREILKDGGGGGWLASLENQAKVDIADFVCVCVCVCLCVFVCVCMCGTGDWTLGIPNDG
jgi:hypothetical protein